MNKRNLIAVLLLIVSNSSACYYPTLKSAVKDDYHLIIADYELDESEVVPRLKLSKRQPIIGKYNGVKYISVNVETSMLNKTGKVIFQGHMGCSDGSGKEPAEIEELWFVKDGMILNNVSKESKTMLLLDFYKMIKHLKALGAKERASQKNNALKRTKNTNGNA